MRKKIIGQSRDGLSDEGEWLDLEAMASVEISSEDADHPIEAAMRTGSKGWKAAEGGEQVVRFVFDKARRIRRIRLVFQEEQQERTQEFSLAWSGENDPHPREIARQQYNFNPPHNIREIEDFHVDLDGVKAIELRLRPDLSGKDVRASLGLIQIA
jgi:hypothetical protein